MRRKLLFSIALLCASLSTLAQDMLQLNVTEDFEHVCTGESLSVELEGVFLATCATEGGTFDYCYGNNETTDFWFCPDTPGDGSQMTLTFNSGTVEVNYDEIIVFDGNNIFAPQLAVLEGNVAGLSYTSTNANGCIGFRIDTDFSVSCESGNFDGINYTVDCSGGENFIAQWEPAELLDDPTSFTPQIVNITEDTEFTVTVYDANEPENTASAAVMVSYTSNLDVGEGSSAIVCSADGEVLLTDLLTGNPSPGLEWTNEEGQIVSNTFDPVGIEAGIYAFNYSSSDCGVQSTVTVEVKDTPEMTISEAFEMHCIGENLLSAVLPSGGESCQSVSGNYSYCYGNNENSVFTFCPDEPGDGSTLALSFTSGQIEVFWDELNVYDGPDVNGTLLASIDGPLAGLSFSSSAAGGGCITFQIVTDGSVSCQSSTNYSPIGYNIGCGGSASAVYQYSWDNFDHLASQYGSQPIITNLDENTTFTVTATPTSQAFCPTSASVDVTYVSGLSTGTNATATLCPENNGESLFDLLGGDPTTGGIWTNAAGDQVNAITGLEVGQNQIYTYSFPNCNAQSTVSINTFLPTTFEVEHPAEACNGETITATASGALTYDWGEFGTDETAEVLLDSSVPATVTATELQRCPTTLELDITYFPEPEPQVILSGNVVGTTFWSSYQWYNDGNPIDGATSQTYEIDTNGGVFQVEVTDDNGCAGFSEVFTVVNVASETASEFALFPNPARESVQVLFESGATQSAVYITNIQGKIVASTPANSTAVEIPVNHLAAGLYNVVAVDKKGTTIARKKLVVE